MHATAVAITTAAKNAMKARMMRERIIIEYLKALFQRFNVWPLSLGLSIVNGKVQGA